MPILISFVEILLNLKTTIDKHYFNNNAFYKTKMKFLNMLWLWAI